MDFKTKWAIQQAHKTLLEFGHLLDERGPSPENDARLQFKIPKLSADAMRAARGLETALQAIDANDTDKCPTWPSALAIEPATVDRTSELKEHVSTEIDRLREWIHLWNMRPIAVEPEPVPKHPRPWFMILALALVIATLMTIALESFLHDQDAATTSVSRNEPRELERVPQTDLMLPAPDDLQPKRTK